MKTNSVEINVAIKYFKQKFTGVSSTQIYLSRSSVLKISEISYLGEVAQPGFTGSDGGLGVS
jgi:hypothetical protein